ncbi:MAG: hypothetical protein N2376_05160 [Clostridia bacterium]|nr:hypothetical protein [Clostridia bacterium]
MKQIKLVPMYLFISVAALLSIFPFLWMIMGATNLSADVTKGKLGFGGELINNFLKLNKLINLPQVLLNTAVIAIVTTLFTLIIASMAGYGFEMYRNKVREQVYNFFLLTMMVPFAAIMIPLFRVFSKLNMLNSYLAVILPSLASVFAIV